MLKKIDIVNKIFLDRVPSDPRQDKVTVFAPSNIALIKYWGKRDSEINLPLTSSLSITLPDKGSKTTISIHDADHDYITLNGKDLANDSAFVKRTIQFIDLFRQNKFWHLKIEIEMNIPVAAGVASSASGFAALVLALKELYGWQLPMSNLSILARLGSGSASRSLWNGFVEWHVGVRTDGMDSFAEPLSYIWPTLNIALLPISHKEKSISSREGMLRTVKTSTLFESWPKKVAEDFITIKKALNTQDFSLLGATAESNALSMHATMLGSLPPVCYFLPETISAMHKIWKLRNAGLEIYFTEDAGPNLKLLFLEKDSADIKQHFPDAEFVKLF